MKEPDLFWDRGTLYAFRGALKAGATDRGMEKLKAYSSTRLLGFHVPYVVEAWPEGNMAHLSAESALYCRIITEGLAGVNPTGFRTFEMTPQLPDGWSGYSIEKIKAFGSEFDIRLSRQGSKIKTLITVGEKVVFDRLVQPGKVVEVKL